MITQETIAEKFKLHNELMEKARKQLHKEMMMKALKVLLVVIWLLLGAALGFCIFTGNLELMTWIMFGFFIACIFTMCAVLDKVMK